MATSTSTTTPNPLTKEQTFSTYSQEQGKKYSQIRRDYHPKVYQTILDHHTSTGGKLDTFLDVGCGPGNVTRSLAPHFVHAIGLDPSEGMIATARSESNDVLSSTSEAIRFEQSNAELLGSNLSPSIPDGSVDLISAGNAAHWWDMSGFWPAAARVLKPGGTVALWTSGAIRAHPLMPNAEAINKAMDDHRDNHLKPYLTDGNLLASNSYKDLPLPWTLATPVSEFAEGDFRRVDWDPAEPFFTGTPVTNLDTFEKMLSTGSAVTRWRQAHPDDVGTEKDVLRIMRKEVERLLHEVGVEKGKEELKGTVHGAILFVKRRT